MTARVLPREEWHRLDADLRALFESLDPADAKVVVIERDGEIVARQGLMRVVHMEGFQIAPGTKGNAGITRALMRAVAEEASEWARGWVVANAADDPTRRTLERMGATRVPVDSYVFTLDQLEMRG